MTLSEGKCRPQTAPMHFVPFRAGTRTLLTQGFHGALSHHGDAAYSVDLECGDGAPVTASRPGRVLEVREDSNINCRDPSCADGANYVVLDHGDGTLSQYLHLRHFGVAVEVGDHVCSGELIGLCGNTGFSTDNHLHFAVTDLSTTRTIPFRFFEGQVQNEYGFPVPDTVLVSQNERRTQCRDAGWSRLPRDAFAHQGIVLGHTLPTVVRDRTDMKIRGRFYGDSTHVAVHRKSARGSAGWLSECVRVDERGRFETEIDWPLEVFPPGTYQVMLTGADAECLTPGWSWSYQMRLR